MSHLSMCLRKFVKLITSSVRCKKVLQWANICFSAHAISQTIWTHNRWNVSTGLCDLYTISNLECCKCARVWFHCVNALAVLRSALKREQWSSGSLPDLITITVNLSRKLGYLSSHKKIKIFQRQILSKTFFHFLNVRIRTNIFHEDAIADHKVEEY